VEALSEVLRAVKLTGAVFLSAEFRAPWCIAAQGKLAQLLMPEAEHFIHYLTTSSTAIAARASTAPAKWGCKQVTSWSTRTVTRT
jgi:AraC family transcriptional regulator, alkane utilization regulator